MLKSDHDTITNIKSTIVAQNTTLQNTTRTLVEYFSKISTFQTPPPPTLGSAAPLQTSPPPENSSTANSITPAPPTVPAAPNPQPPLPLFPALQTSLLNDMETLPSIPSLLPTTVPTNSCFSSSTPPVLLPGSPPPTALAALKPYTPPPTTLTTSTTSLSMTTNPLTTQPINRKSFLSTTNQNSKPATKSSLTFHQTSQAPSQQVINTPSKLISFFRAMSLMQQLKITSDSFHKSNIINEFYCLYDSSEVAKLYDEMTEKGNNALTLPSNLARHFSFAEIESTTNQLYEVLILSVGKFEKNSGAVLFMVLGARPTINPTWPNEQEMADAHNMFVEMKQLICESKVLIFDPGGTLNIESIFDLEDKVDFEGSVMIQLHMQQYANASC